MHFVVAWRTQWDAVFYSIVALYNVMDLDAVKVPTYAASSATICQ